MGLPSGLSRPNLRELALRASLGLAVDPEAAALAFETLEALIDEAIAASEEVDDADDLLGTIARLEKARAEEASAKEERERDLEKERETHDELVASLRAEHGREIDELRARAEKAEHDLAETVRSGHGLDVAAADRLHALEREIVDLRANLEIALTRRREAEDRETEAGLRLAEVSSNARRGAAFWRRKAEDEIRTKVEAELSEMRGRVLEARRAQAAAEAKVRDLLAAEPLATLRELLAAATNLDGSGGESIPNRRAFRIARDRSLQLLQGRAAPTVAPEPIPSDRSDETYPTRRRRRR